MRVLMSPIKQKNSFIRLCAEVDCHSCPLSTIVKPIKRENQLIKKILALDRTESVRETVDIIGRFSGQLQRI